MQKKLISYMSTLGAALLLLSAACGNNSNDGGDAAARDSSTADSGESGKGGANGDVDGQGGSKAGKGASGGQGGGSGISTGGSNSSAGNGGSGGDTKDSDAGDSGPQDGGTETDASAKAAGEPVVLGTAANFAILAKSAISTIPTSAITGDIGVSPAAATYITGFSETADSSNVYATASQVTGKIFAANYAVPTPSNMTSAISDMEIGYTDASARAPDVIALGAGDIGGMTLTSGVYKWDTDLLIASDVTLSGSTTDIWIFQIAGNLTVGNGKRIELAGGALAKNVFWQVAGQAMLGSTVHLEGTLLSKTSITLGTGASVNGRLLAQTAATIDRSTVVKPAQ